MMNATQTKVQQPTASWIKALALVLPLTVTAPDAKAQNNDAAAKAYQQGYNQVLDRNWKGALSTFTALVKNHPSSDWADDADFWRCYSNDQLDEAPASVFACYENHLATYRRSEWSDDAKRALVRLSRQLEGKGDYAQRVRRYGRGDDNRMLQVLVALGEIGDQRSLAAIIQHLDATKDEHLRARIADVLEDIELPAATAKLESLVDTDPSEKVQRQALHAISHHESVANPILMRVLRDESKAPRVRADALEYLSELEAPGMMDLLKDLVGGDDDVLAMQAIDELSDREDRQSFNILRTMLGQVPHQKRRLAIVHEMEVFEFDDAATTLLEIANNDPDPRVREAATDGLADMDTPAAREALIQLLQNLNAER